MGRNTRFFLAAFAMVVGAAAGAEDAAESARVKALMHAFLIEIDAMSPFLASDAAFTSAKGKKVVGQSLEALERKVRKAPEAVASKPGFRISYGLLADHVAKTKTVFDRGEMEYARFRLNGTTDMCAQCHTQTPKAKKYSPFAAFENRAKKPSFDNGNFLFTIRRYDEALSVYDELIRKYPKSAVKSDELNDVFRRKLAMFARVWRDPAHAAGNLREDLKNKSLPVDVQNNVKAWVDGFEAWTKEKEDPAKFTTVDLIAYVGKNLPPAMNRKIAPSDPQLMELLRLSGLLYERLYQEPDGANSQALLFYLGQAERSLSPVYWYSLSEIYFKECVVRFPKQAFSKRCHQAYADGMTERYAGKPMPEPIRSSIEALRDYL